MVDEIIASNLMSSSAPIKVNLDEIEPDEPASVGSARQRVLDRAASYGLGVSSTVRTPAKNRAVGGAKNSYHLAGPNRSAYDLTGKPEDLARFAKEASKDGAAEVFYDPVGGFKRGKSIGAVGGHRDHAHVAFDEPDNDLRVSLDEIELDDVKPANKAASLVNEMTAASRPSPTNALNNVARGVANVAAKPVAKPSPSASQPQKPYQPSAAEQQLARYFEEYKAAGNLPEANKYANELKTKYGWSMGSVRADSPDGNLFGTEWTYIKPPGSQGIENQVSQGTEAFRAGGVANREARERRARIKLQQDAKRQKQGLVANAIDAVKEAGEGAAMGLTSWAGDRVAGAGRLLEEGANLLRSAPPGSTVPAIRPRQATAGESIQAAGEKASQASREYQADFGQSLPSQAGAMVGELAPDLVLAGLTGAPAATFGTSSALSSFGQGKSLAESILTGVVNAQGMKIGNEAAASLEQLAKGNFGKYLIRSGVQGAQNVSTNAALQGDLPDTPEKAAKEILFALGFGLFPAGHPKDAAAHQSAIEIATHPETNPEVAAAIEGAITSSRPKRTAEEIRGGQRVERETKQVPARSETASSSPVEGYTRLYRADSVETTNPEGQHWATDPEYVSQKYGKGQMGSESVWYTDVPTKIFMDEFDHVPAVTTRDMIERLGGKVEPKLFRRVEESPQIKSTSPVENEGVKVDLSEIAPHVEAKSDTKLSRNFRAGTNDAEVVFASSEQRDLYDLAAKSKYLTKGGQNKTRNRAVGDIEGLRKELATALNISESEVMNRAYEVYDDVKAQMKGVKHLESRQMIDGTAKAPDVTVPEMKAEQTVTEMIPDRRTDVARRKRVDEMNEEELRRELYSHELTGMPNRRAYEEAPKKPVQISYDVAGLKFANDTVHPSFGDEVLKTVAKAMQEESGDTYHLKGDEYAGQADDEAGANAQAKAVQERLKNATITYTAPDGTTRTFKGIDLHYGIGKDIKDADSALNEGKAARKSDASGRTEPTGLVEVTATGGQVQNQPAGQDVTHHSQIQNRADDGKFIEGKQAERALPKTLESHGLSPGDSLIYDVIGNDESVKVARENLASKGVDGAAEMVRNSTDMSAETTATGLAAISEYQKAGDFEKANALASDLSTLLTRAGQSIQAVKVIAKFSPERALITAQKLAEKAGKKVTALRAEDITKSASKIQAAEARVKELEAIVADFEAKAKKKAESQRAKVIKQLDAAEQAARERLANLNIAPRTVRTSPTQQGSISLKKTNADPQTISDLASILAAKAAKGDATLADLRKELSTEFGDVYDANYRQIERAANRILTEIQPKAEKRQPTPRQELKKEVASADKWDNGIKEGAKNNPDDMAAVAASLLADGMQKGKSRLFFEKEMKEKFGDEYNNKNKDEVYRQAYSKILEAKKSHRELGDIYKAMREGAVTSEQIKIVQKRLDEARKAHREANLELSRHFDSLGGGRRLRLISDWRKAGLLSSLRTHARNIISNTAYQAFDEFSRVPAVVADFVASKATGQRSITGFSPSASLDGVIAAFTTGWGEAKSIMDTGVTPDEAAKLQIPQESNSGIKIIDVATNTVFRAMAASDRLFYNGALKRNLIDRAKVQALNEAREGKIKHRDVDARKNQLVKTPSDELLADAKHDALIATFNNNNLLSNKIRLLRSDLRPSVDFAIDLVMPFDRTPTNVIARVLEASPLGFAKSANIAAKSLMNKAMSVEEQRQFSQSFGRATTGTALMTLGWVLGAKGLMSAYYDEDEDFKTRKENRKNKEAGKSPMAIKIGNQWVTIGDTNIGNMLAIGATLQKEMSEAKDGTGKAIAPVKTAYQVLSEQPLLGSAKDLFKAGGDIQGKGANYVGRLGSSFVPGSAFVRDIATATDDKARKTFGLVPQLKSSIPGLRQSLPEDVGVQHRRTWSFDPFRMTTDKSPMLGGKR